MALYTLISRDEALGQNFNNMGYGPSSDQTQMWNTLGRNTGAQSNENFFTRRGRSIENAIGTTLAAPAAFFYDNMQNAKRDQMRKNNKASLEDIAKKYGYNSLDDFYDDNSTTFEDVLGKKYGFDIEDYRRRIDEAGNDQNKLNEIDDYKLDYINKNVTGEDADKLRKLAQIGRELRGQATTNANEMNNFANAYDDYRKNNYISQKINQDRGKFLGSAINTLSTATDVLGLTNGPISNAIQGGIEGVADELEQNGLENFDWNRAGQNALVGAASGAAVGAINKGVTNKLAKNGGNLFKGTNKVTKGLNNLGSNTALGRFGSTIATGAGRGALSGAVGGATGAGLSSALNGVDLGQGIANTLQGAAQGAGQGAFAGGTLAGANMAINKTPGVGKFMKNVNQAQQDWQNSGDNFNERLANTYANDNGGLVNTRLGQKVGDWIDDKYTSRINDGAIKNSLLGQPGSPLVANQEGGVTAETEQPEIRTTESGKTSKEYAYRQKRNQKLLDQYGTIDKPTAKAVRAVETVGQIADAGFEKPAEVEAAIKKITGSDGVVNKLNRKVIANAGQVNTMDGLDSGTTLSQFVEQEIRMNGLYGTNDGNAIATEIDAILNQLPTRRNGSITGLDNAEDVFDVVQMLEKHSANYKGKSSSNYATSTPYKEQKAAVIDSVATVLKDRIYDASDIAKVVTPDTIADMKSWYPKNKKWATWVDENIATARTGADLRAAQAPFVRMGKIIDNAVVNSGTFGSKMPRYALKMATSNPLGILVNGAEMLGETPIGQRVSAWAYDKLANRQAAKAAANIPTQTENIEVPNTANPATQVYNAIGRTEGLTNGEQARTANYISDAVQEANGNTLESLVSTPATSATSVYGSVYGTPEAGTTTSNSKSYFQPTGDYWTDILGVAMTSAIDRDDITAFGQLYEMYQTQLANLSKQSTSSSQKLTATQQRANAAMNSLERISQMTPDLAYNLSNIPIIGGIATLGGNDYEAEAKSLAQQIGYMVSGANIKEEEAYNIGKAYVPQPWDNEQVRQNKLRRAYEIIQQYQNGYVE